MKSPEVPALIAAVVLTLKTQFVVEWLATWHRGQFRIVNLDWAGQAAAQHPWLRMALDYLFQ